MSPQVCAREIRRAGVLAWIAFAAITVAANGCRGPAAEPEPAAAPTAESGKELDAAKLRDLIADGALRPVQVMEGDPGFADPSPDGASDPFDTAVEKLEQSQPELRDVPPPIPVEPPLPALLEGPLPDLVGENPYLVFGKRITVYPNGLIMKPYPLRVGTGQKLRDLIRNYGNFPLWESGPQTPDQVRMELLEKWDQEIFTDMRQLVPDDGRSVSVADWLVITAGPDVLRTVEGFLNIFAAGVPQIEIEAKIVEVVLNDVLDLGVRPVNALTPIFGFPDHTFVQSFNYNLPNGAGLTNSFLSLSAVQDGLQFNAVLEALATYENVSIISRPKIAVREGGRAAILNTLKLPVYAISGITADGKFSAGLIYEEVGIRMFVVPRVVGTQTVALNIDIEASSEAGSAVTFTLSDGTTLSNPVISKRGAQTIVYLEPGQAVILGGLITERNVDDVKKVPLLGDIPILGYLFKSTFKRKQQTNVLFFIRPRILQGIDLNREF